MISQPLTDSISETHKTLIHNIIRNHAKVIKEKYANVPDWQTTDSPLKYVDWALEDTINKSFLLAEYLSPKPGSVIYELGPGTGYLMYILREIYGCRVFGCDKPDTPLYRDMHAALGIDTVEEWTIDHRGARFFPYSSLLSCPYDYIIATQISFMDDWSPLDHLRFTNQCVSFLKIKGQLILFPNPKAQHLFQDHNPYLRRTIRLPYLNQGYIYSISSIE